MSVFQRYAVYYSPDDPSLAAFGATWLGWDVEYGTPCQQPEIKDIRDITQTPRKYGFHGTLKPPFRLAKDMTAQALATDVERLAASLAPVVLDGLELARLDQFLALVPKGDPSELSAMAFRLVSELDAYRAPPDASELARRRIKGLTKRQDSLLTRWGYPYVADEFRFHLTLTGKLSDAKLDATAKALGYALPVLPAPFRLESITLVGQREDGMFQQIHRRRLTG